MENTNADIVSARACNPTPLRVRLDRALDKLTKKDDMGKIEGIINVLS